MRAFGLLIARTGLRAGTHCLAETQVRNAPRSEPPINFQWRHDGAGTYRTARFGDVSAGLATGEGFS